MRATSRCERLRFSASRAIKAQRMLLRLVVNHDLVDPRSVEILVGLDVAYRRTGNREYAFGVALEYDIRKNEIVDCFVAVRRVCVPYIPGLLAFREMTVLGPLALKVVRTWRPDVFLVDGHGLSHPRRMGIATHIGVVTRVPSIGVAKKKLTGEVIDNKVIVDGEPLALLVETPTGSTIYVSPGYGVSLETAWRIVVRTLKGRLPEPLRLADIVSKAARRLIRPSDDLRYHRCPGILSFIT